MIKLVVLLALSAMVLSIPHDDQLCLTNSLIVGKEDDSDLMNWNCKVCDSTNKPIHTHYVHEEVKDIKCVMSVYKEYIILAFRYTNTALNVWQDILYPLQIKDEHTCSNCKVQKAYSNMWESIKNQVISDLKTTKSYTGLNTLYITGISMGGGLSLLAYVDIQHEKIFNKIKLTSFGAPRVGNKYWAAYFDNLSNQIHKRYKIAGDQITVLPRCLTLLCTYRHTGIAIVCNPDKQICEQTVEIPDPDDQITIDKIKATMNYHSYMRQNDIGSIVDHANGYPLLYNYTLIMKK